MNYLISGQKVAICDLEAVCQGSRFFDIGFCLGHLLIHSLTLPKQAQTFLMAFQEGYTEAFPTDFSLEIIKKTVLATILYRVDNIEAPYELDLSTGVKKTLIKKTKKLLEQSQADWRGITHVLIK